MSRDVSHPVAGTFGTVATMPIGALEALLGVGGRLAKQAVVLVEALDQRLRDASRHGPMRYRQIHLYSLPTVIRRSHRGSLETVEFYHRESASRVGRSA